MKKFIFFALSLFVTLSSLSADTGASVVKSDETPGLLFEITGKDLKKPSYLFGTIHIICTADMFSMEELVSYLDQTEQLIMEIDMSNTGELQAMTGKIMIPDGKTLKDYLSDEEFAKVDEMFRETLGMPLENLKQIKPFFLSVMLVTAPKVLGCSPPSSYETALLQSAIAKNKTVSGLETVSSQYAVIDKKPMEEQSKDLYKMALDPQKAFNDFKKLVEAYKGQNAETLYELILSQMSEDQDLQTRLLDDRNKDWIPKIEKAINEKPSFIAVGAGHLGGENGVLKLLRDQGYTLRAIKL
jgi:uncharacterized protein